MNRLRRLAYRPYQLSLHAVGKVRAQFPSVRETIQGERFSTDAKKHAVFMHFDLVGQVHDYVLFILDSLLDAGFEITFVTNSPKLPQDSIDLIKPKCRLIVHRYNSGYDFAAYRDGIAHIPDLDNVEALIVMNDSVYGPLFSLKEVLEKVDPKEVDLWGITDSWEIRYHLQGYFMLFFNKAIRSKAFKKFWRKLPNVSSKRWVILNAELKITQKLAQEKLRVGVQCPYWDVSRKVLERLRGITSHNDFETYSDTLKEYLIDLQKNVVKGVPMNQSHQFWETEIRDWNCLFIKRELIQKNPLQVPLVWRWKNVIEECSDYDVSLIDNHLHSL